MTNELTIDRSRPPYAYAVVDGKTSGSIWHSVALAIEALIASEAATARTADNLAGTLVDRDATIRDLVAERGALRAAMRAALAESDGAT